MDAVRTPSPLANAAAGIRARLRRERMLGLVAVGLLAASWWIGFALADSGIESHLPEVWPTADHFEKTAAGYYAAYADPDARQLLGYVAAGTASGYGGPLTLAVGIDRLGEVHGVVVITERETPAWFRKVADSGFIQSLIGKGYGDEFSLEQDVDGITGATYTTRAIADAVKRAARSAAVHQLGLPAPVESRRGFVFGVPHVVLLALFAAAYFGHHAAFKHTHLLRWATMLVGLVVLGFIYNVPLTLSHVNRLLLGFWPPWQTDLYWYLLVGGILFVFTADNKNPYCQWFCPFGAAQECLAAIGKARSRPASRYRVQLVWLRRGLAWFAILLALLFRSPGLTSYEVFGTLFSLLGSNLQFILLGLVLIASLFIRRPWCAYLCPLGPIDEFIRMVRAWILEIWQTHQRDPKAGMAI